MDFFRVIAAVAVVIIVIVFVNFNFEPYVHSRCYFNTTTKLNLIPSQLPIQFNCDV